MIEISPHDSASLVNLARRVIEGTVRNSPSAEKLRDADLVLSEHAGVFVTVYIGGRLRGCIGDLDPDATITEALAYAARSAVSRDHRFPSVTDAELKDLSFDITILEPMIPISSERDILIGRDGLFIEYLASRGLLLPQVASDRQWNPIQFLEAVCEKAGLPRGAWRDGGRARCFRFGAAKIHASFTAETSADAAQ